MITDIIDTDKNENIIQNNEDSRTIELVLIRHGMTKGNEERRFIGRTDEGLSLRGINAVRERIASGYDAIDKLKSADDGETANNKAYPHADILFSSPMKRCIETAAIIYPAKSPIIINELREIDFGSFEYHNHTELDGDEDYQAYIDSNGTMAFPGGEDMQSYTEIVREGLNKLKAITLDEGYKRAVAVVHGGTVMAAGSIMGCADYFDGIIPNGDYKIFRF